MRLLFQLQMSNEYRDKIMTTTVQASLLIRTQMVQIYSSLFTRLKLTGWRAFNSAREAGKMGLEDMVAKLTQSERKGWTLLYKLVCEKAIGSVQSASAVMMSRCVVVAVAKPSESMLVRMFSTTNYSRQGTYENSVCRSYVFSPDSLELGIEFGIMTAVMHNGHKSIGHDISSLGGHFWWCISRENLRIFHLFCSLIC